MSSSSRNHSRRSIKRKPAHLPHGTQSSSRTYKSKAISLSAVYETLQHVRSSAVPFALDDTLLFQSSLDTATSKVKEVVWYAKSGENEMSSTVITDENARRVLPKAQDRFARLGSKQSTSSNHQPFASVIMKDKSIVSIDSKTFHNIIIDLHSALSGASSPREPSASLNLSDIRAIQPFTSDQVSYKALIDCTNINELVVRTDCNDDNLDRHHEQVEQWTQAFVQVYVASDGTPGRKRDNIHLVRLNYAIENNVLAIHGIPQIVLKQVVSRDDLDGVQEDPGTGLLQSPSLPTLRATSTHKGTKCQGDFCKTSTASLLGLSSCFSESELATTPSSVFDTGARFDIGNNVILLCRAEKQFIMAEGADGELKKRWRDADVKVRSEIGRAQPTLFYKQATVCENCRNIYYLFSTARERNFVNKEAGDKLNLLVSNQDGSSRSLDVSTTNHDTKDGSETADSELDNMFLQELAKHTENGSDRPLTGKKPLPPIKSSSRKKSPMPKLKGAKKNCRKEDTSYLDTETSQLDTSDDRQTTLLQESLEEAMETAKEESLRRQNLERQLVDTRKEFSSKIDDKESEITQLRSRIHALETSEQAMESSGLGSKRSSTADEVSRLIDTIDTLNNQLDEATSSKDKLIRQSSKAHQADLKKLHGKYQRELEAFRLSEFSAKEETEKLALKVSSLENEATIAKTQAAQAKKALEELSMTQLVGLEDKCRRLERQLSEAKTAHAKFVNSTALSSPSQGEIEALETKWSNKVEYLKAQLASEMKCREELGQHLTNLTNSMDSLKKEKKAALQEQEEAFKQKSHRLETKWKQEQEAYAQERAAAQGELSKLRANVVELQQEVVLWKSKEESAQLALEKSGEENLRLTQQLIELESQVDEFQEKESGKKSGKTANEETQRMQMEAVLRRLDNERQYLKSQLESEQKGKEELKTMVKQLQSEVQQVKLDADEMMSIGEEKLNEVNTAKGQCEKQLQDQIACLEEEKKLLSKQMNTYVAKCSNLNEQHVLDKDEVEKSKILVVSLQSELDALKEELDSERKNAKASSDRMSAALNSVKKSLVTMGEDNKVRVLRLEEECKAYISRLADAQNQIQMKQDENSATTKKYQRTLSMQKLAVLVTSATYKWEIIAVSRAFSMLERQRVATKTSSKWRTYHDNTVVELEARLKETFDEQYNNMLHRLREEKEVAMEDLAKTHLSACDELRSSHQEDKQSCMQEVENRYREQIEAIKAQYDELIRQEKQRVEEYVKKSETIASTMTNNQQQLRIELEAAESEVKELKACLVKKEEAHQSLLDEVETKQKLDLSRLRDDFEQKLQEEKEAKVKRLEEAKQTHTSQMDEITSELHRLEDERIHMVTEDLQTHLIAETLSLQKKFDQQHAELVSLHQKELDDHRQALTDQWQGQLAKANARHEEQQKETKEAMEIKVQDAVEKARREGKEKKEAAVVQTAAKWQRAMDELQERVDAEKRGEYDRGLQDRDAEWQRAAAQIKLKQKEELESVQKEALAAVESAETRHRMKMRVELEANKKELENNYQAQLNSKLTEAVKKQELELNAAWTQKIASREEELRETYVDQLQQLEARHQLVLESEQGNYKAQLASTEENLRNEYEKKVESLRVDLDTSYQNRLQVQQESHAAELQEKLADLQSQLDKTYHERLTEMKTSLNRQAIAQLEELESQLTQEKEDAIEAAQGESERVISSVEKAMEELKRQKLVAEEEIGRLRSALEEAEDTQFDAEEETRKEKKQAALRLLKLMVFAKRDVAQLEQKYAMAKQELESQRQADLCHYEEEKARWKSAAEAFERTMQQVQHHEESMMTTLTTYKRDELVSHRSASGVLHKEVSLVDQQMEEVMGTKVHLEEEISQLQHEVKEVEASLRELMMRSSSTSSTKNSGDSGISGTFVAKKRRLNEEFDALLEQMEKKKQEKEGCEETLESLRKRKAEKEGELKTLERQLVEILVEQQKQLLSELSIAREIKLPVLESIM